MLSISVCSLLIFVSVFCSAINCANSAFTLYRLLMNFDLRMMTFIAPIITQREPTAQGGGLWMKRPRGASSIFLAQIAKAMLKQGRYRNRGGFSPQSATTERHNFPARSAPALNLFVSPATFRANERGDGLNI